MHSEFMDLEKRGWKIPPASTSGLLKPSEVDESKISFPSESYDSGENNSEASGFWAKERARAISSILKTTDTKTIWEVGAGNGNVAIPLRDLGFKIIAIEPLQSGALTLAKNGFLTFHSTLEGINLPNDSIEAIGAFDVLEHLEKPAVLLSEIYRVLKPGGVFLCSVPAYQWLYSDFDISIGHFRRYSNSTLNSSIQTAGLHPIKTIYLFGFLVVPAYLLRRIPYLFGRRRRFEDVHELNNSRFSLLSKLESFLSWVVWLEQRLHLKFGLSLIALSRK